MAQHSIHGAGSAWAGLAAGCWGVRRAGRPTLGLLAANPSSKQVQLQLVSSRLNPWLAAGWALAWKGQKGPGPFLYHSHGLKVAPGVYAVAASSLNNALDRGGADPGNPQQLVSNLDSARSMIATRPLLPASPVHVHRESVQVRQGDERLGVLLQGEESSFVKG
jgi:hypothetical protein